MEEINELEDSIINVSDMKTKLLTIGKRKNSTIEILQSLKENFETNPDTLAFFTIVRGIPSKSTRSKNAFSRVGERRKRIFP